MIPLQTEAIGQGKKGDEFWRDGNDVIRTPTQQTHPADKHTETTPTDRHTHGQTHTASTPRNRHTRRKHTHGQTPHHHHQHTLDSDRRWPRAGLGASLPLALALVVAVVAVAAVADPVGVPGRLPRTSAIISGQVVKNTAKPKKKKKRMAAGHQLLANLDPPPRRLRWTRWRPLPWWIEPARPPSSAQCNGPE